MGQISGAYDATALLPAGTVAGVGSKAPKDLHKAAVEFESVLLGQWLDSAEKSFADVPGGGDEDQDSGGEQMMGFAMQQLAGSLAAHGGLGIAALVEKGLRKAADTEASREPAGDGNETAAAQGARMAKGEAAQ